MSLKPISVFAINLKSRADRRKFILSQFIAREEFQFYLIDAHKHNIGAMGLWITIRHILKDLADSEDEYIILCQDDHLFTKEYSKEQLLHCINEARSFNADMLSFGVSGFTSAIPISQHIYWVEKFSGLQFTVIFRKFFQKILDADFESINAADLKLCELTENKFFTYPFLSIQKDFGYSDVTSGNNVRGHVDNAFKDCNEKVEIINTVSAFYKQKLRATEMLKSFAGIESAVIPVYVIPQKGKAECLGAIKKQFAGKHEFAVTIIEECHHKVKESESWQSIRKIIEKAIESDDDVIIICREDHQFTERYQRANFLKLVYQAGLLECNILIDGMDSFNLSLPVTNNIFWIDSFHSSQFFVIYRSFYKKILQEAFCDSDTLESKFSEMTSSKMAVHPFISEKKNILNISMNNLRNITIQHSNSNERLIAIKNAWKKFTHEVSGQISLARIE